MIQIAEGFMDKMDEDKAKGDDGKELKILVGIMGDLMNKLEEVEEILNSEEVMEDPLSALINGLTNVQIEEEESGQLNGNGSVPFGGDMEEINDKKKITA